MLYCFGFETVGVVVGDLYFQDPDPGAGQEGAEHGVRLEVRLLGRPPLVGDIYSGQPIEVGMPVWRADLLESVDGRPGSFDRTHHHPHMSGWNVGRRAFVEELSSDPLPWVGRQLADLDALLAQAGLEDDAVHPDDAAALRSSIPEILAATGRLLDRVRAGELGRPPDAPSAVVDGGAVLYRSGWL